MSGLMRTKVISAWDYRQGDVSPFCQPFEADRERLAEDLQFLRKKHSFLVPADRVEQGDIVTLCCRSEKLKFQKDSIPVNVGKGLYSKELEAQLPGMAVGEERKLTAQSAEVIVRVLNIQRTVLPELTDEFVAKNFEGVHTVAELEDWYIRGQLEEYLRQKATEAAEALKAQALKESVIDVDEDERAQAWASGEQIVREQWRMNGLPLEEMTDEQAQEILGYPTAQAFADWFAGLSADEVSFAALGWELLRAEGREPTEESYREAVRKMMEEEGVKPEDLRDYTLSAYARQVCAEHYQDVLEEYAYQIIKEKLS